MPYYAKNLSQHVGKLYDDKGTDKKGNYRGDCVSYVKAVTGLKGVSTLSWRKGKKIFDPANPKCFFDSSIRAGVAIATFGPDERYPSSDRHAAIFVRYSIRGFIVQDQWVKKGKVTEREIFRVKPDVAKRRSNDPDAFFVIELMNTKKEDQN